MALDVHPEEKLLNLSFGARIKLGLILALAHHPDLLLLDEPTVGLDVLSKQQALAECVAAAEDRGCTVLISSHGLSDIERIASHVGFLRKGEMILEGPISGVIARFRRLMFSAPASHNFESVPGLCFQRRDGTRWTFLLDTRSEGLAHIKAMGGSEIQAEPVELEDVFISLMLGK
jgi:ABC-2 type transport system ATP-binding protein